MGGLPAFTTPYVGSPYLTPGEYLNSPNAVDTTQLVIGGAVADQSAELMNVIARASAWIDEQCHQIITATVDVESARLTVNRQGEIRVECRNFPVLEVLDFQSGSAPGSLTELSDLTSVWVEEKGFVVTQPVFGVTTTVGALQLGQTGYTGRPLFCRWAYVNGFPNTILTANAAQGASTIQVLSPVGIFGGPAVTATASAAPPATVLTIYDWDDELTEQVSVASVSGNTLTLNAPLQFAHTLNADESPIAVTAVPQGVREACILRVSTLIETRGDESIELPSGGTPGAVIRAKEAVITDNEELALDLLGPWTVEW